MGITIFADMTYNQFEAKYLGTKPLPPTIEDIEIS